MSSHSLDEFQAAMDERPDDVGVIQAQADFLQEQGDPRGEILAAACEHLNVTPEGNISSDQSAMRQSYDRIMRGDVPLSPEHLEATLRLQYTKQVELLKSLNLLEDSEDGHFITAIDGKQYPLPDVDEILAKMQKPEMQTKLGQGFDTLLLVPFGLKLEKLLKAWRVGLQRNRHRVAALIWLNTQSAWTWIWDEQDKNSERIIYDPKNFTDDHGGRTQEKALDQDGRGWDVLLVEGGIQNLPLANQGRPIGDRTQIECGNTPEEYLVELQRRGEICQTPHSYIVHFLDSLERRGQVLDVTSFSYLLGAYLPISHYIPLAGWNWAYNQAEMEYSHPEESGAANGVRAAVRVL